MSMRMGSSHVWDYGNESPEEYLSDSELEGSSSDEDTSEMEASPHDGRGKRNSKEMLLKQLMSPSPASISKMHTLTEEAESGTYEGAAGECPGSIRKYAMLAQLKSEEESSCGETKSLSSELPQLITAEACAKKPPGHTQGRLLSLTAAAAATPDPPSASALKGIMKKTKRKNSKKHRVKWTKSVLEKMGMESFSVHHVRATDTNVLAVQFSSLSEPSQWHTGDAQFCSNTKCAAIVSHLTKLEGEEDTKTWTCEFCGTKTTVDLVPEEIPAEADTTYLTAASAAQVGDQAAAAGGSAEESIVVFCIDTSGSMCVTTEVPGNYELKGDAERKSRFYRSASVDISDMKDLELQNFQYMSQKRKKSTYLTNMQSVQAAIDTQLSFLARTQPSRRVCLVTFSSDVNIVGDSIMQPVVVAGDHLDNVDYIVDTAKEIRIPAPIKNTQKALSRKVFRLVEEGQTALGPALLTSVVIASRAPGSTVILCTDGLANVGLGKLDDLKTDAQFAKAQRFYDDMATLAIKNSVSVSLVSIRGQECRAAEIGQITTRTGGHITIVDPLTVTEEFSSILANPVIATDTITRVVLHSGLYFRTEDTRESVICDIVGNVTAETELTYEFGVRKKIPPKDPPPPAAAAAATASTSPSKQAVESKPALESLEAAKDVWRGWKADSDTSIQQQKDRQRTTETTLGASSDAAAKGNLASEVPPLMIDGQPHLPFQLQIEYTSLDGDRCLRVITQTKPVTKERSVADKDADVNLVGTHAAKKAADMVLQGQFDKYRAHSLQAKKHIRLMSQSMPETFSRRISSLDAGLMRDNGLMAEPTEDASVHTSSEEQSLVPRLKPVRLSGPRMTSFDRFLPSEGNSALRRVSPRISDDIAERVHRVKSHSSDACTDYFQN